ncbi:MAG: hypothetical protein ACYDA1_06095 [Vulcanimicrobiaceae bacterium]
MNGRWVLAAAFALSVGVVACGGGGGNSNPNPPTPGTPTPVSSATPVSTPTPTPTPAASSSPGAPLIGSCQPSFSGAIPTPDATHFGFTGVLTQNTVYNYPVISSPTSLPPPPPVNTSANVTSLFSVGTAADPSNRGGTDLHVDEYDVTPLQTTTVGSDAWSSTAGGSTGLNATQMIAPDNSTSPTSSTVEIFTTSPVIGSSTSPFGTTNSNAGTLTQTLCYGLTYTRTITASGYTETGTSQNGAGGASGTISISEASDGSGSIVGPNPSGFAPKSFSAPNGTSITLTINPGTKNQTTTPITQWYPTTPSFYSENNSNTTTGVTLPSGCTGTAVAKIERVVTQLDTIMGYTEVTTYDTYETATNGANCVAFIDTLNNYYDWSGDILLANRFASNGASTPLSTTTTKETLAVASGQGKVPFDALRGGNRVSALAVGAAASAHFDAIIAATRARVFAHALRLPTYTSAGGF